MDRRHDLVGAAAILVDDRSGTADLDDLPFLAEHEAGDGCSIVPFGSGLDGDPIADFDLARGSRDLLLCGEVPLCDKPVFRGLSRNRKIVYFGHYFLLSSTRKVLTRPSANCAMLLPSS